MPMNAGRIVGCGWLALLAAMLLPLGALAASNVDPVLKLSWLASCAADAQGFFAVEVRGDGTVLYTGGPQTRISGEHRTSINKTGLKRLRSRAEALVASRPRPGEKAEVEKAVNGGYDYSYCLDVAVNRDGKWRAGRFRSDVRRTQPFIDAFHSVLNEEQWICPERTTYSSATPLRSKRFCGAWSFPPITVSVPDATACDAWHTVDVHRDGTVYYSVQRKALTGGSRVQGEVIGDSYQAISKPALDELMALISGFDLAPDEGVESADERYAPNGFFGTDREQADAVLQRIRAATGLSFVSVAAAKGDCPALPRPVELRYDPVDRQSGAAADK